MAESDHEVEAPQEEVKEVIDDINKAIRSVIGKS
jgi:carbon monoxide dehydrogenase subunit G